MVAKKAGYPNGYTVAPATDSLSIEETEEFYSRPRTNTHQETTQHHCGRSSDCIGNSR
jgi:hypothetical protein